MARSCTICSDPQKLRTANAMASAGHTYRAISEQLQVGRMVVYRHVKNHVVAPAKAIATGLASKGADVRADRERAVALAEHGDPAAFLALGAIVDDLKRVHERLERTADAAEQDKQRLAVASLSSQQLRAAEVRAKIGGVGAYAPQKQGGNGEAAVFSVVFNFSGDRTERIEMTAAEYAPGQTIDMQPSQFGVTTVLETPELVTDASGEADAALEEDV